jgi:two-component system, sensor histidine kinase and response regulator
MDPSISQRSGFSPVFAPAIGLREVLEAAPDLIFCCDAAGRFAWASSTFEYFAGWRASDLVGQSFAALIPASDRMRVMRFFRRQLRHSRPQSAGDFVLLRRDGTRVDVSARVRLYERADGDRYFIGVARERQVWGAASEDGTTGAATSMLEARIRELQAQLDEAHEGERLKGEVLATLAEQLRPSMDAVMGASSSLIASSLTPEQRHQVDVVRGAGHALLTLVSDAHDHTQLEAGRMAMENIGFDLRVTMDQVAAVLAPMADGRGLRLETRADALLPSRLKGDPGRLRQVLLNLGANAIRSSERGTVAIHVDRESEDDAHVTLLFRVSDPSTGAVGAHRALLFREQPPSGGAPARGADMGLSISRRLVHLMGGLLGAEQSDDQRNTFWFRVTFEKQPMPATAPPQNDVRLRGLRVLIADGPAAERHSHALTLQAWGCIVDEAENGIEALELVRVAAARGEPHSVALVDMNLEALDGFALAAAVRADAALDAIAVAITTRIGRPGDAQRARELGVSGYLVMPIEPAQLFDAIAALVAGANAVARPLERPLVTRHSLAEERRARVRILLVEDDLVNQLVTTSALNRVGFHVEVVGTGCAAIERTESEHWDLVLMNVQMTDLDGFRATAAIRARERGAARTPIVGLSTRAGEESERERCLAAGMDDVFAKPIDLSALAESATRWTLHEDPHFMDFAVDDSTPPRRVPAPLLVVSGQFDPPAGMQAPAGTEAPLPMPVIPPGPAIDLEQLNLACMSLPALRASMLHTYLGDVFQRLQRIEEAIESGDAERTATEAHGLRGMCRTIGATACTVVFGEMEERARAGRLADAAELLPIALEQVRRTEEFIARFERIIASDAA